MAIQYRYEIYDAHKMGWAGLAAALDAMTANGWTIHTVVPAFSEIYIVWQREDPDPEPGPGERGEFRA